jgi:opacity protein-like surface antigen
MKKIIFLVIMIIVLSSFALPTAAEKVRVTVDNANVRSQPGLEGKIVLKASKGDVFEVIGKSNDWFKVLLPAEAGADTAEGYIKEAVVEILAAGENVTAASTSPRPKTTSAKTAPRPRAGAKSTTPEKLFSGLAVKFGIMTTPAARFGDRWLLAFTFEKGINPFLTAGLELQPYFRSFSDAEISDSTVGANLFLNAKGGVNIGRFVESLRLLTPYAGFGLGMAFAASSSKSGSEKVSRTDFNFAWHLMFGLEVVLKKLSLIYEIQIIKISVPETNPDPSRYFMMLGIRF